MISKILISVLLLVFSCSREAPVKTPPKDVEKRETKMDDANKKQQTEAILKEPPKTPDKNRYYLFYLHGLIVEGSDGRPKNEEHGYYEYAEITDVLSKRGFVVTSEIRPRNTVPAEYAEKVAGWIAQLITGGVPASHIIVVGASKGGVIATLVSNKLSNADIRYAILSGLFKQLIENDPSIRLHGHVLSIHDSSDKYGIAPELFFEKSDEVSEKKIVVTNTGLGHGLLYTPRPEWVEEVVKWSGIR